MDTLANEQGSSHDNGNSDPSSLSVSSGVPKSSREVEFFRQRLRDAFRYETIDGHGRCYLGILSPEDVTPPEERILVQTRKFLGRTGAEKLTLYDYALKSSQGKIADKQERIFFDETVINSDELKRFFTELREVGVSIFIVPAWCSSCDGGSFVYEVRLNLGKQDSINAVKKMLDVKER
jgi:hypothetical protein